jgi:hypothetical protein
MKSNVLPHPVAMQMRREGFGRTAYPAASVIELLV